MENKKEVSLEEARQAADLVAKVELSMTDEIKLAYEMSGRRQAMASIEKLVTVANTVELQRIKESKSFKHLVNPEASESGTVSNFSTWSDFCRVIVGCDRKTIDERILNLNVFGQEAIDGMNSIGLGVRQLRQLRKLPDDQLKQAKVLAKEKDVDSLKDLIEEQAVEKAKQKEEIEALKKSSEESAEIAKEQLKEKSDQINDLDAQLKRRTKATPDEIHADLMTEIDAQTKGMMTKIAIINARTRDLMDAPEGIPLDMRHHIGSQCYRLMSRLKEVIHNNDLSSIDMVLLDDDDLDEDGNLDWVPGKDNTPSIAEKKAVVKLLNEQGETQSLGMAVSDAEAQFMTGPFPLDVWKTVLKEYGFEGNI